MPRWASWVTRTVTDVRAQRLQEITSRDIIAEGVRCENYKCLGTEEFSVCRNGGCFDRRDDFLTLWDSLNANRGYGWEATPWVAAYTFTVERQNIDEVQT